MRREALGFGYQTFEVPPTETARTPDPASLSQQPEGSELVKTRKLAWRGFWLCFGILCLLLLSLRLNWFDIYRRFARAFLDAWR